MEAWPSCLLYSLTQPLCCCCLCVGDLWSTWAWWWKGHSRCFTMIWPKMVPLLHPFPSSHILLTCLRAFCGSRWPEKGRKDVLLPQLSSFPGILAERTGLYAPGLSSRRDMWQKCLIWSCLQLLWCNIWMQMCNICSWSFKYILPLLTLFWSNNWENLSKFTLIYHLF